MTSRRSSRLPTIQRSLTAPAPVVPIERTRSGSHPRGPTSRRRNGSTVALVVGAVGLPQRDNSLTIDGPVLSLAPRHAKVRRDGYRW